MTYGSCPCCGRVYRSVAAREYAKNHQAITEDLKRTKEMQRLGLKDGEEWHQPSYVGDRERGEAE